MVAIELLDREIDEPLADDHRHGDLIGASPAMRRLYPVIERSAAATATVLIEGETGTGKELVAEAEHFWCTFRPDAAPPAELIADLVAQPSPGNVRELRNAIERAAASAAPTAMPHPPQSYVDAKAQAIDDWERGWVEQLLAAHHGNLSRAARAARMGRSHLRQHARRHLPACDADLDPGPTEEPNEEPNDE